jgi:hypothetical protein
MKQPLIRVFVTAVFCVGSIRAQSGNPNRVLSNSDIITMSRAGVPASTIATAIQSNPVKFDVSPEALVALHQGGVDQAVLNQMIRAVTRQKFTASFGVATGTFPVNAASGQTAHLSGWIKTEGVLDGYAGLWWRVDGEEKGKVLAFDNSQARIVDDAPASGNGIIRGATGTTGWNQYEIELPVAVGAHNINFGLLFTGTGTAWFDALRIELNGVPYTNPQLFDLDFESSTVKGFYTGGRGYKVGIDTMTAWTGNQSLKMQFIGDGGESK